MTRKILKTSGQVVFRSTVRPLTDDEWADEDAKTERTEFNKSVHEKTRGRLSARRPEA